MFTRVALLLGAAIAASASPVSQVHLGLTTDVNDCDHGVVVQFASAQAYPIQVSYSVHGDKANVKTVESASETYTIKHGNYSYASPNLHKAFLCDLAPATKYTYNIGGDFSKTFLTPNAVGSDKTPTMFVVVGDPGDTSDTGLNIVNMLKPYKGLDPQALFIAGDYSYANGDGAVWDEWYNFNQETFSQLPQLGINGNHETITFHGHNNTTPNYQDIPADNYRDYLVRASTP
ncbi:hypothetical protein As57867_007444, partial [Aphanomyces stellatus]